MSRAWRSLASPRLAGWLIGALLVLSFVSVTVPQTTTLGATYVAQWRASQPWLAGPLLALGLDRVFASWPYLLVSALLALNLTACTIDRVRKRRPLAAVAAGSPPAEARAVEFAGTAADAAATLRRRLRSFELREAGGVVVCRSGRFGFAGSVAMHLGMIALVLAGLATSLTRFEGSMLIVEGQTVTDSPAAYLSVTRAPRLGSAYTGASLRLDDLAFEYAGSTITSMRASMTTRIKASQRSASAEVNRPLKLAGKSYLPQDAGYAAQLGVTSPAGEKVVDAYVNLGVQRPGGYADSLQAGPLKLDLLAVPDASLPSGAVADRKLVPVDPGVWLSAEASGTSVARDSLLRPGQSVDIEGWRVSLRDVRRWNRFNVRMDRGLPVAALGFALLVGGMALRLADPDRILRVRVADGRAEVWCRARWGASIAEGTERAAVAALQAAGRAAPAVGTAEERERA